VDEMIRRAIDTMYDQYCYSLSTQDLAAVAALSPFHFIRKFSRATGVTPGNFLAAIRIAQAKWLLHTTALRVSDIMYSVGYHSVGTFTRKFTASVGKPPTIYRASAVEMSFPNGPSGLPATGTVTGILDTPAGSPVHTVVVGVFAGPAAWGRPERIAVLDRPGPWRLEGIRPGVYHVTAVASLDCWNDERRTVPIRDPAAVGTAGPLTVLPGSVHSVRLRLLPWPRLRMPVLFPLPCVTAPCVGIHP